MARWPRRGRGRKLDARLDQFAARIAAELDGDWDEVQIVTHSAGTILGMSILRRVFALRGGAGMPDHAVMVGMGQVVPVIGLRPRRALVSCRSGGAGGQGVPLCRHIVPA